MLKSLAITLLGIGLLASPAAFGAEKTVTGYPSSPKS